VSRRPGISGIPRGFGTAVLQTSRSNTDARASLQERISAEALNEDGILLPVVHLSGLQRSRRGRAGRRRSQPSASVPGQSRTSDRAPQPRTSRTASAIPIETLVRWHCRSAPRSDCAHLERLDRSRAQRGIGGRQVAARAGRTAAKQYASLKSLVTIRGAESSNWTSPPISRNRDSDTPAESATTGKALVRAVARGRGGCPAGCGSAQESDANRAYALSEAHARDERKPFSVKLNLVFALLPRRIWRNSTNVEPS